MLDNFKQNYDKEFRIIVWYHMCAFTSAQIKNSENSRIYNIINLKFVFHAEQNHTTQYSHGENSERAHVVRGVDLHAF